MREAAAKRPFIDITEFERRLRGPLTEANGADPFEELERMLYGDQAATCPEPRERSDDEANSTPAASDLEDESRDSDLRDAFVDAAPDEPQIERRYPPEMKPHARDVEWTPEGGGDHLDFDAQREEREHTAGVEKNGGSRFLKSAAAGLAALGLIGVGLALASHGEATLRTVASVASLQGQAPTDEQGAAAAPRSEIAGDERPADPPPLPVDAAPADAPARPSEGSALTPLKVKSVQIRSGGNDLDSGATPSAGSDRPLGATNADEPSAPAETESAGASEDRLAAMRSRAEQRARGEAEDDVSSLEGDAQPASGRGGAFEVRFGSAETMAEARRLMNQTADKLRSQLGGRPLGYRHAKVDGKTVYVVRLRGRLDKKSADGVCKKIKSKGEDCAVVAM